MAQNVVYDHQLLTSQDGLASTEVLCDLQDSKGFLWFGTRNGLNRYDGKKFNLVTMLDRLRENRIVALAEDAEKLIWINYPDAEGRKESGGLTDIYNPCTGEITSLEKKYPHLPFDIENIVNLSGNREHDIYILAESKLFRLMNGN